MARTVDMSKHRAAIGDLADSLQMYHDHGVPTGGFLEAMLSGDLFDAVARADGPNRQRIGPIAIAIMHELPRSAWGSREAYAAWTEQGGAAL